MTQERFRLGRWQVDTTVHEIHDGDQRVHLEPRAVRLLNELVTAQGKVVTRSALYAALWPDVVVNEDALSRLVSELRQALGDHARSPTYIETVPRQGYRLLVRPSAVKPVWQRAALAAAVVFTVVASTTMLTSLLVQQPVTYQGGITLNCVPDINRALQQYQQTQDFQFSQSRVEIGSGAAGWFELSSDTLPQRELATLWAQATLDHCLS